ncbi:unnamed protein product [Candidula unifasciata]|uniref:Uncharacterized protein n=1 Tax=Candidula unifasciata TaxID=100452 RepID=A0A8S3YQ71_9EUPU|nr:unnamed protein product [Candidula unifasciata]
MSGRLGVQGALNRPRTLNPLQQVAYDVGSEAVTAVNNAATCKLERELKTMQEENLQLRRELHESRMALKQLFSESSHEKFDERRVNLLKFQLIQLERQIAILNEALSCRQEAVLEVENTMAWLADRLRSYIAAEVKGPAVPIARSDLTSMTEVVESSRIKLFKALEGSEKDAIGKDVLFLNQFLGGKYKNGEPLTVLDISLQRMNYINLRHVAQLESKLCQLYKELIGVNECLCNVKPLSLLAGHINCAEKNRMETMLLKACVVIQDVSDDLMALSLLCPSAPWPVLKRPIIKQIPAERVIAALPALPPSKQEEVKHIIEASIHTCNHHQFLLSKQLAVLKEELAFHRSVYSIQSQYVQDLFDAVRKGYEEFEASLKSVVCSPLKEILDAYQVLKNSASEDAFRKFLLIIKANEEQLMSVVETFSSDNCKSDNNDFQVFSKFGEEFMDKINSLVIKCQHERDAAAKEHKEVKEEQAKKDLELQRLLEDLENKYAKTWIPVSSGVTSENKLLLNEKDAISQKSDKHVCVSRENSAKSKRSLKKDEDVKFANMGLDSRSGEDVTWCCLKDKCLRESSNFKDQTNVQKEPIYEHSLSVRDDAKYCARNNRKTDSVNWKPDKEWNNDFTGLSNNTEESALCEPGPLEEKTYMNIGLPKKQHCRNDSQKTSSTEQSTVKSRKSKHRLKKSLSYEPNLTVVNRNLKLKKPESLSKTGSRDLADDNSLS